MIISILIKEEPFRGMLMFRLIILFIAVMGLSLSNATFAKGPADKAYEHADDNASFKKGKHNDDRDVTSKD